MWHSAERHVITHNGSKFPSVAIRRPVWATSDFASFEVFWSMTLGSLSTPAASTLSAYAAYTQNLLTGADYIGVPVMQYQGYNGSHPQTRCLLQDQIIMQIIQIDKGSAVPPVPFEVTPL